MANIDKNAHDFLKKHPVGVLATVDPNGEPHAAVIYFSVSTSSDIYFLTKTGTKKADNLRHNPHAVLVAYDAATQTTVQVTGMVSEIKDHAEVNDVFAQIINASIDTSGISVPPITKLKEGDYVVFKLDSKQIRMAEFAKQRAGESKDVFRTTTPAD